MSWKEHRAAFVVGTAATVAGGVILAFNWLAVWNGLITAWEWVTGSASHPRWLLGLLWLSLGGWVLFVIARIRAGEPSEPAHHAYMRDNFFNVVWRWTWHSSGISTPIPFCPECDLQIIPQNTGYELALTCSECSKTFTTLRGADEPYLRREVEMRVLRNARRQAQETSK
jgi:hypothetical protein